MWTPAQVKAAYTALSPAPATLAAAAATLNAQTVTTTVDVPVQAVSGYLEAVGKLAAIEAFATSPPSGASAAAITAAQELMFALKDPQSVPIFQMTNSTIASAVTSWLAALVSPGTGVTAPIDATDQAAILALSTPTVPVWQPAVTAGDIQTALALVA